MEPTRKQSKTLSEELFLKIEKLKINDYSIFLKSEYPVINKYYAITASHILSQSFFINEITLYYDLNRLQKSISNLNYSKQKAIIDDIVLENQVRIEGRKEQIQKYRVKSKNEALLIKEISIRQNFIKKLENIISDLNSLEINIYKREERKNAKSSTFNNFNSYNIFNSYKFNFFVVVPSASTSTSRDKKKNTEENFIKKITPKEPLKGCKKNKGKDLGQHLPLINLPQTKIDNFTKQFYNILLKLDVKITFDDLKTLLFTDNKDQLESINKISFKTYNIVFFYLFEKLIRHNFLDSNFYRVAAKYELIEKKSPKKTTTSKFYGMKDYGKEAKKAINTKTGNITINLKNDKYEAEIKNFNELVMSLFTTT